MKKVEVEVYDIDELEHGKDNYALTPQNRAINYILTVLQEAKNREVALALIRQLDVHFEEFGVLWDDEIKFKEATK